MTSPLGGEAIISLLSEIIVNMHGVQY